MTEGSCAVKKCKAKAMAFVSRSSASGRPAAELWRGGYIMIAVICGARCYRDTTTIVVDHKVVMR